MALRMQALSVLRTRAWRLSLPRYRNFSSSIRLGNASGDTKTRNIGIIAHIDAGKTTTTERMLYYCGLTSHIGDVDQGDTVTDYLQAERDRGITITSAAVTFGWGDNKINLIDTPGHADFTFEVIRSIRVLDGAVTVLDGVAGVEAQTEKVWHQAAALGIPRIVYVNKMDRPGAGFGRTVREVVGKLNTRVAIANFPYFSPASREPEFCGVVDVIDKKVILWDKGSDGKDVNVIDIQSPDIAAEVRDECVKARSALIESLCEFDEQLLEEFLACDDDYMAVPSAEIKRALRQATLSLDITPVVCGASFRNIGVQPLIQAVVDYLPSPNERPTPHAISRTDGAAIHRSKKRANLPAKAIKEVSVSLDDAKLTCALAFKVMNDPIRGVLVFVRVYSGSLQAGSTVLNTTTGQKERISKLLQMQADTQIDIPRIERGNIGVIVGSKEIRTGDTLVAHALKKDGINSLSQTDKGLHLHPIEVPPAVFFAAITPKSVSDTRGMEEALDILLKEDPSLRLSYDEDSGQSLLAGMGELHLEIAQDRLINDFKARVTIGKIMISYKESLQAATETVEKEVDETGGAPISVKLRVEPFVDEESDAMGSAIEQVHHDEHYVAYPSSLESFQHPHVKVSDVYEAIRVGVRPSLAVGGKIARLPLHSVVVRVDEVTVSDDCTSAAGLATAVRMSVQEALHGASKHAFTVMEPIMDVKVTVNEEDIGHVVNDISSIRRGHIVSLDEGANSETISDASVPAGLKFKEMAASVYVPPDTTMYMSKHGDRVTSRTSVIRARIPLRFMVGYLTSLRSLTQGRATFVMAFDRYEVVAPDAVEEIVASAW